MSQNDAGITGEDALILLKKHLKNEKLICHCMAAEVIMQALARRFGEDETVWGLTGLLHDLDYELVNGDPRTHGLKTAEILEENGVSPAIIDCIKKHNAEELGLERTTVYEHALAAAETITGLIVATALIYPDKKLSSVKTKSVTKRMKTPHFARAVNRDIIMECETIGIPINEFVTLSIEAMKPIAGDIGI